jgi:L-ascorbate metabolism protein UlaG (beta-lactamase superfamily)/nitrite reductase/ring-hydroxylating ferredoxin subunit
MDEVVVTGLGHAGLRIDAPGIRLLADPWVSPTGAFLGSWFPFPDNAHLAGPLLEDVDVVVVSHEHLDHMDLAYLQGLPLEVPVVVPRYPSTVMQRRLGQAGRTRVVVLDPWQRYPIGRGDDWLTVIPEQCPMSHDAAVLVSVAGRAVLHANDARISLGQVRRAMDEVGGDIDLMGVQMSGASWHPVCYDYEDDDRERISESKRVGKFKAVTRLVRSVQPRLVMPYAGPPCFLDEDLFEHNSGLHGSGIFPDQGEALRWLQERLPHQPATYLLPGDSVALADPPVVLRDRHWAGFSLEAPAPARRSYLERYAERRRLAIDQVWAENPEPSGDSGLAEQFKSHFESLGTLSSYFLARINMTLRFDVSGPAGGTWDVHIGPEEVHVNLEGGGCEATYLLQMDARWLEGVVSGRTRWEELLLSLRFSARREPDHYNDYLVGLLKHADLAALRAVEEFETTRDPLDRFELEDDGRRVLVSRYCPHAGEDLTETAVVSNGVLRCLGHNFEFDLTTGECLNARCEPLVVSPAETEASLAG